MLRSLTGTRIDIEMQRRYYLSKFVGDGKTQATAFRAKVSEHGKQWNMIDLRTDQTAKSGWCFACVDLDDHRQLDRDPELIPLGTDPYANLPEELRKQVQEALGESFSSLNLSDIIFEVLLRRGGLRPSPDGKYQVWLGSLLKESNAEEAIAFIGRIASLHTGKSALTSASRRRCELGGPLREALETVAWLANHGDPGWLERELKVLAGQRRCNPLASNYKKAQEALMAGEDEMWRSHSVHWIMMLARDASIAANLLDLGVLAARLRSDHDCEPVKYELYVMAGYLEAGAQVRKTDQGRTGEFRVAWNGPWVHVECKQKSEMSLRDRHMKEAYERTTQELHQLMVRKNAFAQIHISSNTDLRQEALAHVMRVVDEGLTSTIGPGKRYKRGKLEILIVPSSSGEPSTRGGPRIPMGYDYAVSEGRVAQVTEEGPVFENLWCVAWRSSQPSDWIKSSLESFHQAASQLPKEGPSLVYIEVPPGTEDVVAGRVEVLAGAMEKALKKRKRINAVIPQEGPCYWTTQGQPPPLPE